MFFYGRVFLLCFDVYQLSSYISTVIICLIPCLCRISNNHIITSIVSHALTATTIWNHDITWKLWCAINQTFSKQLIKCYVWYVIYDDFIQIQLFPWKIVLQIFIRKYAYKLCLHMWRWCMFPWIIIIPCVHTCNVDVTLWILGQRCVR